MASPLLKGAIYNQQSQQTAYLLITQEVSTSRSTSYTCSDSQRIQQEEHLYLSETTWAVVSITQLLLTI